MTAGLIASGSLLLAWALDRRFGEPPSVWHPVAWFGSIAAPLGQHVRTLARPVAFVAGAVLWCGLVGSASAVALALERIAAAMPTWMAIPLLAVGLKPTFAWRMLKDEVRAVESALEEGLEEGRTRVARLCSRDVAQLDEAAVRETAIETLAENFNDSLIAPLFWFVVAGLPGAWAWRAANTLDAMWGYRGPWEWAGKWAARADDLMGWVPARLSAMLLWRPGIGLVRLACEARLTPSPNGGWPMAAMALRIGTRLGKPGVYTLNACAPAPQPNSISRALAVGEQAALWAIAAALVSATLRTAP